MQCHIVKRKHKLYFFYLFYSVTKKNYIPFIQNIIKNFMNLKSSPFSKKKKKKL